MSGPIITGVVLTSLGAFIGGLVVAGFAVLIILKQVRYESHNGGVL